MAVVREAVVKGMVMVTLGVAGQAVVKVDVAIESTPSRVHWALVIPDKVVAVDWVPATAADGEVVVMVAVEMVVGAKVVGEMAAVASEAAMRVIMEGVMQDAVAVVVTDRVTVVEVEVVDVWAVLVVDQQAVKLVAVEVMAVEVVMVAVGEAE
jgi:hypothetical protein